VTSPPPPPPLRTRVTATTQHHMHPSDPAPPRLANAPPSPRRLTPCSTNPHTRILPRWLSPPAPLPSVPLCKKPRREADTHLHPHPHDRSPTTPYTPSPPGLISVPPLSAIATTCPEARYTTVFVVNYLVLTTRRPAWPAAAIILHACLSAVHPRTSAPHPAAASPRLLSPHAHPACPSAFGANLDHAPTLDRPLTDARPARRLRPLTTLCAD